MNDARSFRNLISRVQAGEGAAAATVWRRYGPAVHRVARGRLFNPRLRRLIDAEDICQSVWKSFFTKPAEGEHPPETPEQLLRLLKRMVHRKLIDHLRRQTAQRRDQGRVEADDVGDRELAISDPTPSEQVAAQELIDEVRRRLSAEELHLQELRDQGRDWAAVAAEVGGSPEALRKKLDRALARVRQRLGLVESSCA